MPFLLLSAGERRKLDIEYFSKLLEMILEVQKNRKKHKSLADKNDPKKKRRKTKGICSFFYYFFYIMVDVCVKIRLIRYGK